MLYSYYFSRPGVTIASKAKWLICIASMLHRHHSSAWIVTFSRIRYKRLFVEPQQARGETLGCTGNRLHRPATLPQFCL